MKNKIVKAIVAIMCVSTLLSACGTTTVSDNNISGTPVATVNSQVDMDAVVMTVVDMDVTTKDIYLYLIQYIYNAGLKDGADTSEILKSVIAEVTVEYVEYQVAKVTDELNISDNDFELAKNSAATFYQFFGADFLGQYGITEEDVMDLFERQAYINSLTSKALNDLQNDYIKQFTEDYADQTFHSVYYALFPSIKYGPDGQPMRNEDGSYVKLDGTELDSQKLLAEEFCEKAKNGENTMEELVTEYGIESYSDTERNVKGAYSAELNDLIESLAEGDISDVVETDAGYMIVRMDVVDDKDYKEFVINYAALQNANNMLPKLQENWMTASGATGEVSNEEEIRKIDIASLIRDMNQRGLVFGN